MASPNEILSDLDTSGSVSTLEDNAEAELSFRNAPTGLPTLAQEKIDPPAFTSENFVRLFEETLSLRKENDKLSKDNATLSRDLSVAQKQLAQAASNANASSIGIARLPHELLLNIFTRLHTHTLYSVSLSCRALTKAATDALYQHPVLPTGRAGQSFRLACEAGRSNQVHSVVCSEWFDWTEWFSSQASSEWPGIREFTAPLSETLNAVDVVGVLAGFASQLTSLTIENCTLHTRPGEPVPSFTKLPTSYSLPALRELVLLEVSTSLYTKKTMQALATLCPNVTSLTIMAENFTFVALDGLSGLSALTYLDLQGHFQCSTIEAAQVVAQCSRVLLDLWAVAPGAVNLRPIPDILLLDHPHLRDLTVRIRTIHDLAYLKNAIERDLYPRLARICLDMKMLQLARRWTYETKSAKLSLFAAISESGFGLREPEESILLAERRGSSD